MEKIKGYSREDLFSVIPNLEEKRLLDVGTGRKRLMLASFLKAGGNKNLVVMIDKRVEKLSPNAGVVLGGNVAALPFKDHSFDVVAMGWLLDLLMSDTKQSIKEVSRVLKPGGFLIADEWQGITVEGFKDLKIISSDNFDNKCDKWLNYKVIKLGNWIIRRIVTQSGFNLTTFGLGFEKNRAVEHNQPKNEDYLSFFFLAQKTS